MRNAIGCIVAALALVASPSAAGVYYKAVTTVEGQQGVGDTTVQAWIEGEKARIEFVESGDPLAPAGAYLLTQDAGRTILLVNPEDKTYAGWDVSAMLGMAGAVMKGMGPLLKVEFSEPRVEKLAEEAGGTVAGLPTRHYRYRTSYTMKMRVLGRGREAAVVSEQDIWATDQLADAALGVWLRSTPPRTGDEQLDKLLAAEMGKFDGFPLKTVTVTTNTPGRGQPTTTRSQMEVKELRRADPPAGAFQLPAGYREAQLLPTPEG